MTWIAEVEVGTASHGGMMEKRPMPISRSLANYYATEKNQI
jgi:hypothetical protein